MIKKYNSATILKGIACVMVFMSHWYNAFYGWGFQTIDSAIKRFPISLIYNGNLAVCLFMVLSGFLFSLKIFKNKGTVASWTDLVLKRYFRLTVPIVILSVIALAFLRAGLFYNIHASNLLQNEWLSWYYDTDLTWRLLLSTSFIKTLTVGDSLFYGPLWMMKYMFWGAFFCIIFSNVLLELNKNGRIVLTGCLFIALFVLNSYYICFLLGIVLAFWDISKPNFHSTVFSVGCLFAGCVCVKLGQILPSYFSDRGYPAILSQYSFYNMLGAFGLVWGSHLLIDKNKCNNPQTAAPFLWLGKHSFSVFFTHWIVICSFSSWFYVKTNSYGARWSISANFILSFAITMVTSYIFYRIVEVTLFEWSWNKVKELFLNEG